MPISTVTNRVGYQGDGTSAVFAFPYRFHALTDLGVFVYNSSVAAGSIIQPQVLNTNYTLSATANAAGVYPNGGSVVFNSSPNAQSVIVIFRSSIITNGFVVGQNGSIPSVALNNEIDYLTLIAQRLQDQTSRSVRLADGHFGTFDPTLPADLGRIGSSTIMVNGQGTGLTMGPTADQIFGAQSSAIAAAASAAASGVSASQAAASAVLANSAAVSAGNAVVLVNSAAASVNNAVGLIGSTAFWGVQAQSSALSASNSVILCGSAVVSAGNQAVLAGSAALSASNSATLAAASAVIAGSASVSATNQAVLAGSAALSANNAIATIAATSGFTVQVFNSGLNQVYTVPASATWLRVRMVGGGGGGGGGGNGSNGAGGGGAGGAVEKVLRNLAASYVYTVGMFGPGAGASTSAGTDGGLTHFNSTITCAGGVGGTSTSGQPSAGGAGGTAANGDINVTGGGGTGGCNMDAGQALGGNGGASFFGGGGQGGSQGWINPTAGAAYGAGGGGGGFRSSAQGGGNGAQGVVIVEAYYK